MHIFQCTTLQLLNLAILVSIVIITKNDTHALITTTVITKIILLASRLDLHSICHCELGYFPPPKLLLRDVHCLYGFQMVKILVRLHMQQLHLHSTMNVLGI